jgi:hypothetical protein
MSVQRTYARVLVHGFIMNINIFFIIYLYNNAKIVIEVYEEGNGERASFTSPRLAT